MIAQLATPFVRLGPAHVGALLSTAVVTAILCFWLRRTPLDRLQPRARGVTTVLATASLLIEVGTWIFPAVEGFWSPEQSLPLHLCDLAVFVSSAAILFAGYAPLDRARGRLQPLGGWRQFVYETAYYWGVAGTIQALLTPELQQGFPHPAYFLFFGGHGLILVNVLVATIGLRMRPGRTSAIRVFVFTLLVAAAVGVVNGLVGGNYMYLAGPPAEASLYDYLGPWPYSLAGMAVAGLVIMHLCYLPFFLHDAGRWRRAGARDTSERGTIA